MLWVPLFASVGQLAGRGHQLLQHACFLGVGTLLLLIVVIQDVLTGHSSALQAVHFVPSSCRFSRMQHSPAHAQKAGRAVINRVQLLLSLQQVILGFFGPVLPLLDLVLLMAKHLFQEGNRGGILGEFCSQLLLAFYLTHCRSLQLLLGCSAVQAKGWPPGTGLLLCASSPLPAVGPESHLANF